MSQKWTNNPQSTLAVALGSGGGSATMTVQAGHGNRFPVVAGVDYFYAFLENASNNIEIVKVTDRASGSDSMTIARAQQGTTARAWLVGDLVELRLTAEEMERFERASLRDGDTYTGIHDFSAASAVNLGAIAVAASPALSANSGEVVTAYWVKQIAFATALPSQAGHDDNSVLTTDGTDASFISRDAEYAAARLSAHELLGGL